MSEAERGGEQRSWWEKPDAERSGARAAWQDAHDPYRADDAPGGSDPYRGSDPTQAVPQAAGTTAGTGSPWPPTSAPEYPPLDGRDGWGHQQQARPQHTDQHTDQYVQPQHAEPHAQQYAQQYGPLHNQTHGAPTDPYGQPPVTGAAHAVLWTSVGGLVLLGTGLGWIAAIVALALTPGARREILAAQGTRRGLGHLLAGKIIAWVTIALSLLFVVGLVAFIAWLGTEGAGYYDGYGYDSVGTAVQV
ncbi:hypothetical protein [Kineococcus arenarius]|uniref:hypothetical protein n=1 Tax=unclassified Kineococcus TaxID=2621656 RepID=UPI003D7EDC61